jgi:hypothetical protein
MADNSRYISACLILQLIAALTSTVYAQNNVNDTPFQVLSTTPTAAPKPTAVSSEISFEKPSNSVTLSPVTTERVSVNIDQQSYMIFVGVGTIPTTDVSQLLIDMKDWFEDYYNKDPNATQQRTLQQQQQMHRGLQQVQQVREPEIRNMEVTYTILTQDVKMTNNVNSNTVSYTQNLTYDATTNAKNAEYYTLLPFADTSYKTELLQLLQYDIDSFANLTAIVTSIDAKSNAHGAGGRRAGTTIGIIICLLFVVTGVMYVVRKHKLKRSSCNDRVNDSTKEHTDEHGMQPEENTRNNVFSAGKFSTDDNNPIVTKTAKPTMM